MRVLRVGQSQSCWYFQYVSNLCTHTIINLDTPALSISQGLSQAPSRRPDFWKRYYLSYSEACQERGKLFVMPGTKVYEGMIIGQNAKDNDLEVNPLKANQLTNIRTTSKDEAVRLTPIVPMTLEQAMAYIQDYELVEVTPYSIRIRKKALNANLRKRTAKQAAD